MLYAIIFYFSPAAVGLLNENARLYMLAGIIVSTFFIPVLFIYILYQFEAIDSLQMQEQKDRTLPFIITTLIYGTFTYFFFWRLNSLSSIYLILGSITVAVGLVTIINLFWKISAHSVGISGLVGSLMGIHYKFAESELFYPILFFILIAGLLMSARLSVNAHNPVQILGGCVLGLLISLGSIYWFL